jgi:hypothetical protein
MSDEEVIRRFESDLVPEDSFHHADHVRLAFAYLSQSQFPPLQALERFSAALKRFAAARGKAQLYHETITHAYFFLIRERMARSPVTDWDEFSQRNPDLLIWKDGILTQYYEPATLQSELARTVFVFPDKAPATRRPANAAKPEPVEVLATIPRHK